MPRVTGSTWVRRLEWAIAFAGALPFAVATVALLWGDSHIRVPAIAALVTVSAIVLSHLGGIEAGLALHDESATTSTRTIAIGLGVVASVAAWSVLWLPSPQSQLATSLGLFVAMWGADLWLSRHGLVPSWFVDLRTAITALVAVILGIALYLL
ncbi:MAG TPA: DUF3429 domain-containing protein [Usitatibacter sp.]|nr:DUF3429 domain-containing protein [Usitatibacter sp.]